MIKKILTLVAVTLAILSTPTKSQAQVIWWNQLFFHFGYNDFFPGSTLAPLTATYAETSNTLTWFNRVKINRITYPTGTQTGFTHYNNPWHEYQGYMTNLHLYGKVITPKTQADTYRSNSSWVDVDYIFLDAGYVAGYDHYEVIPKDINQFDITSVGNWSTTSNTLMGRKESLTADPIHTGAGDQIIQIPVLTLLGETNRAITYTGWTKQNQWTWDHFPTLLTSGSVRTLNVDGAQVILNQETWSGSGPKRWTPTNVSKGEGWTGYIQENLSGTTVTGYTWFKGNGQRTYFTHSTSQWTTGKPSGFENYGHQTNTELSSGGGLRKLIDGATGNYIDFVSGIKDHTNTRTISISASSITLATGETLTIQTSGGRIASMKDPSNNPLFQNTYTGDRIESQTDGEGNPWDFAYEHVEDNGELFFQTTETRPNNQEWVYLHDRNLLLVQRISPLGHEIGYEYNAAGLPTTRWDQRENYTEWEYNAYRLPTSYTDEAGNSWLTEYNANLDPTATEDPLGNRVEKTYGTNNTVSSITDELNHTWNFAYNSNRQRTVTTYPNTSTETTSYAYGNPTGFTSRAGNTWTRTFNTRGFLWKVTDPASKITEYTYDAMGRITKVKTPLGHETETTYMLLTFF